MKLESKIKNNVDPSTCFNWKTPGSETQKFETKWMDGEDHYEEANEVS